MPTIHYLFEIDSKYCKNLGIYNVYVDLRALVFIQHASGRINVRNYAREVEGSVILSITARMRVLTGRLSIIMLVWVAFHRTRDWINMKGGALVLASLLSVSAVLGLPRTQLFAVDKKPAYAGKIKADIKLLVRISDLATNSHTDISAPVGCCPSIQKDNSKIVSTTGCEVRVDIAVNIASLREDTLRAAPSSRNCTTKDNKFM